MKTELIAFLGQVAVNRLNALGVILAFVIGAIGFYELATYRAVTAALKWMAFLQQFFFHSRTATTVENLETGNRDTWNHSATGLIATTGKLRLPGTIVRDAQTGKAYKIIEEVRQDYPPLFYFIASATFIAVILISGNSILYWAAFPFRLFSNAFTVWGEATTIWSVLVVSLKCLLYVLLGVIAFALVYTFGIATTLKSAFLIADRLSKKLSRKTFKFLLFLMFIVANVILIVTSVDL